MEGDTSAKAPVTRLRRRLSVESEDSGSPHPSAPSTPTKRRGRLAAKPQLDLIEENATPTITSTKNSKTTIVKEKECHTEEKNVTPSRRSTRIKSNVSEVSEDKPTTPAKRNTKIKSNTSLLSDSIVANSPRALRAARRTSQAGSDNEVSLTPIKKTRKTRKDSTSSIENKAESPKVLQVVIENITEKSKNDKSSELSTKKGENTSPGSTRKSTRLLDKSNTKLDSSNIDEKPEETDKIKRQSEKHEQHLPDVTKPTITDDNINVVDKKEEKNDYEAFNNPTNELGSPNGTDTKKDNFTTLLASNHSTQNLQSSLSWTNQLTSPSCDSFICSDNESVKKSKKKKAECLNEASLSSQSLDKDNELEDVGNDSAINRNTSNEINNKCTRFDVTGTLSATEKFMEKSPGKSIQSTVYIEDLDTDKIETIRLDKNVDDQCVPVVERDISNQATSPDHSINPVMSNENANSFDKSNKLIDIFAPKSINASQLLNTDSCEPMDIDETLPANISLKDRKKSLSTSQDNNNINISSHSLDKIGNENKSTLILSQIKDISSNENNTSKSSEKPDNSEILSKSYNFGETTKKIETAKKRLSLIESSGTPSHENLHILSIQTSTPVTLLNKKEKPISNLKIKNKYPKGGKFKSSGRPDTSSEESSIDNNSLVDDKALVDDDYESGDSQDEEERQYAIENEVLDKGETLSTDEDVSNDSDYEKDSFVVSSNEEDEELLSGSGDNLSMSDNELSMSRSSKEKYNARKAKERKQLSKEMYEARHGLTDSNKKTKKTNRLRLDSNNLESEEDSITMPKKKNRMRLDSSHDASMATSDFDDSINGKKKNKKVRRLSESLCIDNETEITNICSESVLNQVDPLSSSEINKKNKPETPKNSKKINIDIEKVEVEENVTLQKSNDTHDPLGATMVDDESSLSENEQIKQNYDDILSELNEKSKPKKNKHYDYDISLDLNGKKKKPRESTIVDQLNITQTKKKITKILDKGTNKVIDKTTNIEELSSDSIDFKLLFNEDSSDGQENRKKKTSIDFIPLKKTEGKTNIRNNSDVNNEELKTKTSRTSENNTDVTINTVDHDAFIDGSINNSTSSAKNEKKNTTNPRDYFEDPSEAVIETTDATDKTPKSDKKKKKKDSELITDNAGEAVIETNDATADKTPKSDKKKKNSPSESITHDAGEAIVETSDTTVDKTPNSAKKKKKTPSESITDEAEQNVDVSFASNSSFKKKNKMKESTNEIIVESANEMPTDDDKMKEFNVEDAEIEVVEEKPKSKKKRRKHSKEVELEDVEMGLTVTKNKTELTQSHDNEKTNTTPTEERRKKDKKTPKTSECIEEAQALKLVEETNEPIILKSKKRKRSLEIQPEEHENVLEDKLIPAILNKPQKGNQKKKLKLANIDDDTNTTQNIEDQILFGESSKYTSDKPRKLEKKKKKKSKDHILEDTKNVDVQENIASVVSINKKRKTREDENPKEKTKGFKENILDKVHVPRLPESILSQIEDKPAKKKQKSRIISTTPFVVEKIISKKSKPSNFLEESVYINNDFDENYKGKKQLKKPKVLPTVPTAQVSDGGATTNFVATKFVAQSNSVTNFKNEYLYGKNIKRLGTYELYKRQRNVKLSKF